MPLKSLSAVLKPRNLRLIIFSLVVGTLIIALYHIYYGSIGEAETTQSNFVEATRSSPTYEQQPNYEINQVRNGQGHRGRLGPQAPTSFSTMRNTSMFSSARKPKDCSTIDAFTPDFDALDVYPNLPFDAEWIRGKEYWNTFFERRYTTQKKSEDTNHLKVFVIPHSHTDPGWLRTFEDYFHTQTKNIIDNAVDKLTEFRNMTFQWSEMSFLSKWWEHAHPTRRAQFRALVKEGRMEIVTGGWVMTDEATVNLYSMIDQLVEGHQWVKEHLDTVPKTSWSVDPFGHGSTFPYILKSAGINAMVIQRIHYAWKKWLAEFQRGDFLWVQRWDSQKKNSILCHNAPFDIYSIKHSCGPHPHICLYFDFRNISGEFSENYLVSRPITTANVKEKAELMLEQYGRTASLFPHNVAMISMGDDFRFDRAAEWDQQYVNYMKLFDYINANRDRYKAEVKFGTISEYFAAIRERSKEFPTFSGDFFVYSDIFTDGRPAYWSGYYATRPYWKKFYRETENNIRSAELLFTLCTAIARQKRNTIAYQLLSKEYEKLIVARRWLALFAHHDATTGTSKMATMNDYGLKLMEAYQSSLDIQMMAIHSVLFENSNSTSLSTDFELSNFGRLPEKLPLKLRKNAKINKRIVLFNNLGWHRQHLAKVVVDSAGVEVIGPDGNHIVSQLNPILDLSTPEAASLSSELFELEFLANLPPLSVSTFTVRAASSNKRDAVRSVVYCRNCTSRGQIFEIKRSQPGDIQLNNDRLQLLFDRNTGMLLKMTMLNDETSVKVKLSFGGYSSIDYRSGAYLLMPDTRTEQQIPFAHTPAKVFIFSGPISSEISVFHSPVVVTSRILHTGGKDLEEAVFVQNQIDLGKHNAEMFMRFETDLNSATNPVKSEAKQETEDPLPTFYSDQNGFSMEKRVKIPNIRLEGNYYPANTMAYIQDEDKGLRFSVLMDRSHGFSSFETGRLETFIERRTVFDDARGMGEGVTDNRDTISNYVLLLEKIGKPRSYHNSLPTLAAQHASQELNYPPSLFVSKDEFGNSHRKKNVNFFPFVNQELPCDSHLITLRTVSEKNEFDLSFPSSKSLLIVQRLGYLCNNEQYSSGCGNPNPSSLFYPDTQLNAIYISSITPTDLTGVTVQSHLPNFSALHEMTAEPLEIKSALLDLS